MNLEQSRARMLALLVQVAPEVSAEDLDPDTDLREEVDLDSLDFLNLVERVAQDTGVDIPEADYPEVRSLNGLATYVAARSRG